MGRKPIVNIDKVNIDKSNEIRSDPDDIRRSFRVPVDPSYGIQATLNQKTYPVSDISPEGISILCRDHTAFTVAQIIENCELILPDVTIKNLTARVVHFSCPSEFNWTNGIQWVNLADDDLEKIAAQVSKLKKELLESDD